MFPKYKQRYYLHLYARVVAHTFESFRVYSHKKESYRLLSRNAWEIALCFDFVYSVGASRSSESLLSTARAFFFPPSIHPWLPLHTTKPFGRYRARRLYKFYIIFMRHKVVEKPADERREKKRVRERRRGRFLGPNHPSRSLTTPASRRYSHVAGRSGLHPLVLARRRGVRMEKGKLMIAGGDAPPRKGWWWWIVVRRTNCILRNASCLVLLKNSRSLIYSFFFILAQSEIYFRENGFFLYNSVLRPINYVLKYIHVVSERKWFLFKINVMIINH